MLVDHLRGGGGGAERFLLGLATHLPRDRFEVLVCTTRRKNGGLLYDAFRATGIEHVALDRRHRGDVVRFRHLVELLRTRRIEVLHAHKFGSNVWGTLIGRLARVPVIIAHEQTWSYEGNPVRRVLDGQFIGRFTDAFVAVSQRDADRMVALEGVPHRKLRVIPNAYIPRPTDAGRDLRRELGIAPHVPVIGTAAVMRPQKALHVLLDAFALVRRALPDAHLLLAGHGALREALERQTAELGLTDRVHFLGYWQDLGVLLGAVDVAAMSSDFEGTPLFAIECMAHGTPLVSTAVGGIHEVLEDGHSVLLVPPRDATALAGALETLLRDPGRRAAQAAAAAQKAPRYEIATITREFVELYEGLAADKLARRQA
jgi:glycosyltransferase involved in cell wall biosynthesis